MNWNLEWIGVSIAYFLNSRIFASGWRGEIIYVPWSTETWKNPAVWV